MIFSFNSPGNRGPEPPGARETQSFIYNYKKTCKAFGAAARTGMIQAWVFLTKEPQEPISYDTTKKLSCKWRKTIGKCPLKLFAKCGKLPVFQGLAAGKIQGGILYKKLTEFYQ